MAVIIRIRNTELRVRMGSFTSPASGREVIKLLVHGFRWLALFEVTADGVCRPTAAALFIEKARMIAQSLELGIATHRGLSLLPADRLPGTMAINASSSSHGSQRRASPRLGHTGQPLTATRPIQAIYLAAALSALARIIAAFHLWREPMLYLAATTWVAAFVGFLIVYGPRLVRRP
jgi:hypothetical protein